jgi:hypothetical protein
MSQNHASNRKPEHSCAAQIGRQFFDGTLPHCQWTHEAHLAAGLYLLLVHKDLDASLVMPRLIRRYNWANGVANNEQGGFHATLTEFYLRMLRKFLARGTRAWSLQEAFRAVIDSELADREFPLRYYSCARLFSPEARRRWLDPDLHPPADME